MKGIKIIRYEESIYYANAETFKYKVIKLSEVDPFEIINKIKRDAKQQENEYKKLRKKKLKDNTTTTATTTNNNVSDVLGEKKIIFLKFIILTQPII